MKARFSLAALLFLFVALPFSAWGAVSFGPPGGIEHRSKYISPPAAAIDDLTLFIDDIIVLDEVLARIKMKTLQKIVQSSDEPLPNLSLE